MRRLIIRLAALTAAGSLALAELGSGWTFSVNGYGQERPLAAEQGTRPGRSRPHRRATAASRSQSPREVAVGLRA